LLEQQLLLLFGHELLQFVQLALLDFSKDCGRNNLELIRNAGTTNLKVSYFFKVFSAVGSTLLDERVSLRRPVELGDAGLDEPVQTREVLVE
jgi:hypothetical protein